jgi:hypothetical protein
MLETIRTYENVDRVATQGGNLLLYSKNNKLSINDVVIEEDLKYRDYNLHDDVLIYSVNEENNSTNIYRIADRSRHTIPKKFKWHSYVNGVGVFADDKALYNVDIATGNILSTFTLRKGASPYYFKDHIIHNTYENNKQERVLCYDRLKQTYLWEYDVKEEGRYIKSDIIPGPEETGEVKKILGIYRSVVIIAITGERLIAIDVNTGKKVWKIESIPEAVLPYMKSPKLPSATHFKIEAETGRLVCFHQSVYINIDIETGEVKEVVNAFKKYESVDMRSMNYDWYKEGAIIYYFTAGFHRGELPQVIAWDTNSQTVIWTHIIQHENRSDLYTKYFLRMMQYDQGKFFVLDSNDILFVLKNIH